MSILSAALFCEQKKKLETCFSGFQIALALTKIITKSILRKGTNQQQRKESPSDTLKKMLAFDGAVEHITFHPTVENPLMDQMGLPVVDIRPSCIACTYQFSVQRRQLRVTQSGGLYFCRDDKVLESFDGRNVTMVGDLMRCAADN